MFVAIVTALLLGVAHADAPPSIRQPHPIDWMHGSPVGEQPGWSDPFWINFEVGEANVWSIPTTFSDNYSNNYTYQERYEQTSGILEIGHSFFDRIGASVVVPYAYRWG